jgi:putative nucleotidyltransferase with HDIG domain
VIENYPDRKTALKALEEGEKLNPGKWKQHSEFVAGAAEIIAEDCGLDKEKAYVFGLLHDIGRRTGISSERHIIDGYKYCREQGWDEVAKICITHSFPIQRMETALGVWDIKEEDYKLVEKIINLVVYDDYDLLVQLCDYLALPTGFCKLEKRFSDTISRYGWQENTELTQQKIKEIKSYFEKKIGKSIYQILPGII